MKRAGAFFFLLVLGLLVFYVGGYWASGPTWVRTLVKTLLPLLFFGLTVLCTRHERIRHWRKVFLCFLAATTGFLVAWWLSGPLLKLAGVAPNTLEGIALAKFFDAACVVFPVILVCRVGGLRNEDLYLCHGRVKLWLAIGLLAFLGFSGIYLFQLKGQGMGLNALASVAPWTLIFVLSNGFLEELHFRGLFLGSFEPLVGAHGANLCIALFFTLIHIPVSYTQDLAGFLTVLFLLALAWGWIIQKTHSLWGAVLFHAGADLLVVSGIYASMGY